MTMRTLLVLLDKEFRQFFRNPFLPKMAVMFPLMVMLVIPWVTTQDVRHVGVAVVDHDRRRPRGGILQKIGASDYYTLYDVADSYASALGALEEGGIDVIVEIPDGFERSVATGTPRKVSISANGVNALKGSLGSQYMVQTVMQTLAELRAEKGLAAGPTDRGAEPLQPHARIPFLHDSRADDHAADHDRGFLPALNLVGEKEKGTIEQINVTPVDRFTFTLAKLVPYWVIGLVLLAFAMLLAWVVYGLVPMGSFGAICLAAALFILTMSGIGVVIANNSDTMQQAMFVMFFFVMLFVLMSGLVTPVESMPGWAQWITRFLPPRYFVGIMRAVYLKGTTFAELWGDYAVLAVSASVFGLLAALTYRKRM